MWYSKAVRKPVAYTNLRLRRPRRAAICHTNGGPSSSGSLYGWWKQKAASGSSIGAHFQIAWDGRAEQYVDSSQVVYHAFSASEWAFGIETQDDRDPSRPWTKPQVATIVDILYEHRVPAVLLAAKEGDGIGWHSQADDWNRNAHDCPGGVRSGQIVTEVIPALRRRYEQGDDMPLSDEDVAKVAAATAARLQPLFVLLLHGDATHPASIDSIYEATKQP